MSNLSTTVTIANEIIKAVDFTFAHDQVINNIAVAMRGILAEPNQDMVIGGAVKPYPSGGMNVYIEPIFVHCGASGVDAVDTEINQPISFESADQSLDRIDIIQVRGIEELYDKQDRRFRDPETKVETTDSIHTKKRIKLEIVVKKGLIGSVAAPIADSGYVKLAEISISAGTVGIGEENIRNISARYAGAENEDWTNQQNRTFNPGYLTDIVKKFLVSHKEDGKLKDNAVLASMIKFGNESGSVNGRVIPIGQPIKIAEVQLNELKSIAEVLAVLSTQDEELQTAIEYLIDNKAPATASLTAENGNGINVATPDIDSMPIGSILQTIWGKIRQVVNVVSTKVDKININALTTISAKKIAYNVQGQITATADLTKTDLSLGNVTNDAQVKRSEMGIANGVATLGNDGKVPNNQLPIVNKGELCLILNGINTKGAPIIAKGSVIEVNGECFEISENTTIEGPIDNDWYFLYAVKVSDKLVLSLDSMFRSKPAYDYIRKGWYQSNRRAIVKMFRLSSGYYSKVILQDYNSMFEDNFSYLPSPEEDDYCDTVGYGMRITEQTIKDIFYVPKGVYKCIIQGGKGGSGGKQGSNGTPGQGAMGQVVRKTFIMEKDGYIEAAGGGDGNDGEPGHTSSGGGDSQEGGGGGASGGSSYLRANGMLIALAEGGSGGGGCGANGTSASGGGGGGGGGGYGSGTDGSNGGDTDTSGRGGKGGKGGKNNVGGIGGTADSAASYKGQDGGSGCSGIESKIYSRNGGDGGGAGSYLNIGKGGIGVKFLGGSGSVIVMKLWDCLTKKDI